MSAEVTATLASISQHDGGISDENVRAFCELLDQMRVSMASTKDTVKSLREKYAHCHLSTSVILTRSISDRAKHRSSTRATGSLCFPLNTT